MDNSSKKSFLLNISFVAVTIILIYIIVRFMLTFLFPFIIGIVLSYCVQKPAEAISKKTKMSKGVCAAILVSATYILIIGIIGFFVWLSVSGAINFFSASGKFTSLSDLVSVIRKGIMSAVEKLPEATSHTVYTFLTGTINNMIAKFTNFVSSFAASFASGLPSFLLSSIVTVVASCYIAKDFDRLVRFFKGLINDKTIKNILIIKEIITGSILKFAAGYLILMLITFFELLVGFLIIGEKHYLPLALIIAVIDILPVLGTGTVLIPWSLYAIISGNVGQGIGLLVIYAVITILRNVLEPRIIGKSIGINPLLMLITMFVGLRFSGIIGMFAVPMTVIVVIDYYKIQYDEENAWHKNHDVHNM